MGAKHPARNPAKYLAPCPRNFPALAGQWQRQCRRASVKTTRKTTCLAPDLAAQCPRRKLARQLATWPRTSRETSRKMIRQNPAVMFLTIPFQNYEHLTHITDNTQSGFAAQSNSGISTRSKSHSIQQFEAVP
jgi:hypothetical protein